MANQGQQTGRYNSYYSCLSREVSIPAGVSGIGTTEAVLRLPWTLTRAPRFSLTYRRYYSTRVKGGWTSMMYVVPFFGVLCLAIQYCCATSNILSRESIVNREMRKRARGSCKTFENMEDGENRTNTTAQYDTQGGKIEHAWSTLECHTIPAVQKWTHISTQWVYCTSTRARCNISICELMTSVHSPVVGIHRYTHTRIGRREIG